MNGSISSKEPIPSVQKLREFPKKKIDVSQAKDEKEKIKVESSPLFDYVSMPKANEIDLIDSFKSKVRTSLHNVFQTNVQGPRRSRGPKFF